MVKINEQVAQLITKLEQEQETPIKNKDLNLKCCACSCSDGEHEEYVYCRIVDGYICDVCCKFELCNDYQLVNQILEQEVFSTNEEVLMLCEKYCSCDSEL